MKALAAALLVLVLAGGHCISSDAPSFNFTLGDEYTYKVEIKRQWREAKGLPNWVGKLKVWPLAVQADGRVQVVARLTMNPDRPGIIGSDDTIAWAEFAIDPTGRVAAQYEFALRSDETAPIPMTFLMPAQGETSWQERRINGTVIDYQFSPGSDAGKNPWEIGATYHNPRYEVQRARFHSVFTYDSQAKRMLKWADRGDYLEGPYVWVTTTATFLGERTVPLPEMAQIWHDSAILYDAMVESNALEDDAENPLEDLAAFHQRLNSVDALLSRLDASIEDPEFREDCVRLKRLNFSVLRVRGEGAIDQRGALVGKPSPDWTAKDLAGQTHALKDYRGKIVLLDFWAHTCGPCLLSVPFLNKMECDYAGRPFEVVGVNVGDGPEDIRRAMAKMGMTNTQLIGLPVASVYPWSGLPTYLLIDAKGIVRYRHVGWDDSLDPVLRCEIDQLLRAVAKN